MDSSNAAEKINNTSVDGYTQTFTLNSITAANGHVSGQQTPVSPSIQAQAQTNSGYAQIVNDGNYTQPLTRCRQVYNILKSNPGLDQRQISEKADMPRQGHVHNTLRKLMERGLVVRTQLTPDSRYTYSVVADVPYVDGIRGSHTWTRVKAKKAVKAKSTQIDTWISVKKAEKVYGYSKGTLCKIVSDGDVKGTKMQTKKSRRPQWFIDPVSLEKWANAKNRRAHSKHKKALSSVKVSIPQVQAKARVDKTQKIVPKLGLFTRLKNAIIG